MLRLHEPSWIGIDGEVQWQRWKTCSTSTSTSTTRMTSNQSTEVPLEPFQESYLSLSLSSGILRFGGPFTLKSGRKSPYFFNAGTFFESGDALAELANCYAQAIVKSGVKFDVLFGPAYKVSSSKWKERLSEKKKKDKSSSSWKRLRLLYSHAEHWSESFDLIFDASFHSLREDPRAAGVYL